MFSRLDETNCPELGPFTDKMSINELKKHLLECGWTMDRDFNLHDPSGKYPYPIGCVVFEDGVALLLLNPVL